MNKLDTATNWTEFYEEFKKQDNYPELLKQYGDKLPLVIAGELESCRMCDAQSLRKGWRDAEIIESYEFCCRITFAPDFPVFPEAPVAPGTSRTLDSNYDITF